MRLRLWAIVAAGLLVAADDPKADAVKDELAKMQGAWRMVSGARNGEKIPDDEAKQIVRTFTGEKFVAKRGEETVNEGTVQIDPSKKPKTVDVRMETPAGETLTVPGIYELDGDSMKTCLGRPSGERPKEFDSKPGSGNSYYVWKREKK